jgi:hypothetical protein
MANDELWGKILKYQGIIAFIETQLKILAFTKATGQTLVEDNTVSILQLKLDECNEELNKILAGNPEIEARWILNKISE